ncbi:MAG TPA: thioredoxin family protein [Thermoplasmata archaeon]|nr:thioredoxin family protein [Thermoplasmata archaeon]
MTEGTTAGAAVRVDSQPLSVLSRSPPPTSLALGDRAVEFSALEGVDGVRYSLEQFRDAAVVVLMFTGNACPAAKGCMAQVVAFQEAFGTRGVKVVGIDSNNPYLSPEDTMEGMVRTAATYRLNFPFLKDPEGRVARQFGAVNTPHFLVLDQERRLRYRGRMFDSREPERATTHDLHDAVVSLLEGRPVALPETKPLGCSIVW